MKIYTKLVIDMNTDQVIEEESYDYEGSVALADFGGGGGAFSAAADAQTNAINQAIAAQQAMYAQTRQDMAPYRDVGAGATPYMAGMFNIPGYASVDPTQAILNMPGLSQAMKFGQDAMVNKGLSSGQYGSGAFQKGLQQFGQDTYLTKGWQPYYQGVSGLADMGQSAAAQTGQFGQNEANAVSQLLAQQGQAQSQGILGQYAAGQQGTSSLLGGLGMLGGLGLGALGMPFGGSGASLFSILAGNA